VFERGVGETLACGTGAFQPVCAYVNVGHRGEVTNELILPPTTSHLVCLCMHMRRI